MGYKIEEVEGIGPAYREKLVKAEIRSTDDLLKHCGEKQGRQTISQKTGLSEAHLLNWANKADLMRISGVGPQFAELLEASGVDTVKELQHRRADNLAQRMEEVNTTKKLAKASPNTGQIEEWIQQAKTLKPSIQH